jgi:hypothetical protein
MIYDLPAKLLAGKKEEKCCMTELSNPGSELAKPKGITG